MPEMSGTQRSWREKHEVLWQRSVSLPELCPKMHVFQGRNKSWPINEECALRKFHATFRDGRPYRPELFGVGAPSDLAGVVRVRVSAPGCASRAYVLVAGRDGCVSDSISWRA